MADTIAAIATPPGIGGVGIVRISGPDAAVIGQRLCAKFPASRTVVFTRFLDCNSEMMDEGIVLYFRSPASFTGEDVVELQGHGGPVVLNRILETSVFHGARIAFPGEFSERAFLNGKLDLVQVEAVADLIESTTERAAKLATRTLAGEFSKRIENLLDQLIGLRSFIEAAVDFPEEEVDFLKYEKVTEGLDRVGKALSAVLKSAAQGRLLRDGMTIVIAGRPNVGKSSLLNALAGYESAIVTPLPGTTRDLLKERIQVDGLPLHIIDTAGLRDITDLAEKEGIRRAKKEIEQADRILWICDAKNPDENADTAKRYISDSNNVTWINNKIDLKNQRAGITVRDGAYVISLSAKTGEGIDLLREHLKECSGYDRISESEFIARQRHLDALNRVKQHLQAGERIFKLTGAAELIAEELRLAQNSLSEITGEFVTDDLLAEIFGRFCIGK